jgi:hypothetical protein
MVTRLEVSPLSMQHKVDPVFNLSKSFVLTLRGFVTKLLEIGGQLFQFDFLFDLGLLLYD